MSKFGCVGSLLSRNPLFRDTKCNAHSCCLIFSTSSDHDIFSPMSIQRAIFNMGTQTLHVKRPLSVPEFNQNWNELKIWVKFRNTKFHVNHSKVDGGCETPTHRQHGDSINLLSLFFQNKQSRLKWILHRGLWVLIGFKWLRTRSSVWLL
jgi:hypothetical protein